MEGAIVRGQLEAITTMIMERVAAQLPESYRGEYALKNSKTASEVVGGESASGGR